MLPSFPATFPSSDVGAPLPDFDTGFTPWADLSSLFDPLPTLPKPDPNNDPPFYSSTSPVDFSSTQFHACFDSDPPLDISGSDPDPPLVDPTGSEPVSIVEERKRKRKESNRESARRSRMRRQNHLKNIVEEANRLEIENRELTNRLNLVKYYSEMTRRDNERMLGDCVILQRRLTFITQILHSHQLHTYSIQNQ